MSIAAANDRIGRVATRRALENPNQSLEVKSKRLFCDACQMVIRVDPTSVSRHIIGKKHKKNIRVWLETKSPDIQFAEFLAEKGLTDEVAAASQQHKQLQKGFGRTVSMPGSSGLGNGLGDDDGDEKSLLPMPKMSKAVTTMNVLREGDEQEELEDILGSLREAAEVFASRITSTHFSVGLVGCQQGRLETPKHYFLNQEVSVAALRAFIGVRFNVPADTIRLLFGGAWLADNKRLGDYGIEEDSQLVVVFRDASDGGNAEDGDGGGVVPAGVNDGEGAVANVRFVGSDAVDEKGVPVEANSGAGEILSNDVYGARIELRDPSSDEWKWYLVTDVSQDNETLVVMKEGIQHYETDNVSLSDESRFREGIVAAIRQRLEQDANNAPEEVPEWVKVGTEEPCMITHETDESEPRYKMPCSHPITEDSLIQYVTHELMSTKVTQIKCPFIVNDAKCGAIWPWPVIRFMAPMDRDERHRLELQASFNRIEDTLNAQKCQRCGIILYRTVEESDAKTQCPNCSRGDDGVSFCWMCRTEYPANAIQCPNEECPSRAVSYVMEILQNCDRKTIGYQSEIPSIRACPNCGQLIYHTEACKHMQCYMCKKYFCFVCLLPMVNDSWQCGSYSDRCPNGTAPVQGGEVISLAGRVRLDVRADEDREMEMRRTWNEGDVVEYLDRSQGVRVWKVGIIFGIGGDGGENLVIKDREGAEYAPPVPVDRFGTDVRQWLILRD